jgi:hypothetical protein
MIATLTQMAQEVAQPIKDILNQLMQQDHSPERISNSLEELESLAAQLTMEDSCTQLPPDNLIFYSPQPIQTQPQDYSVITLFLTNWYIGGKSASVNHNLLAN